MSNSDQELRKTWRPDLSHLEPSVQKENEDEREDERWKPDFGPSRGTTGSASEASSQVWKPDILSPTTSSNNQGTTNPTESSTSSSENTQGPTSTNAGSNNASSSNAGSNNASSTTPVTTNPNSTSANGSNIPTSNGVSNDAKPANGAGNATGSGGSSTGTPSGASTTKPESNQPTTGGSQPTPQPGTTVEKPTGGQPSSGGATTNADPWNASTGKVDDKGLVQSPARGGTGGTPFSDASFVSSPQTASITAVKIHYKTGIDRIQISYGGKWAEAHGGSAGLQGLYEETFYLQRGEAIVQIEGRSRTKLDSLQFTTSTGRKSKVYGGTGGYSFSWSGKRLVYISGRSGDQVDSLQSYWAA